MTAPTTHTRILVFGNLLSHLRRQGFRIGVGHYLRLQELLNRCGPEVAPQDLKTLLCPLFATSRSEQEQFYRYFDEFFALFKVAPPELPPELRNELLAIQPPSPTKLATRKKVLYLSGATVFIVVAAIVWICLTNSPVNIDEQNVRSGDPTPTVTAPTPAQGTTVQGAAPPSARPAQTPSDKPFTKSGQVPSTDSTNLRPANVTPAGTPVPIRVTQPAEQAIPAVSVALGVMWRITVILAPLIIFLFYDQSAHGVATRPSGRVLSPVLLLTVLSLVLFWVTTFFGPYFIIVGLTALAYLALLLYSLYAFSDSALEDADYKFFPHLLIGSLGLTVAATVAGLMFAAVALIGFGIESPAKHFLEHPRSQVFNSVAVLTFILFLILSGRASHGTRNKPTLYHRLRGALLGGAVASSAAAFLYFVNVHQAYALTPLIFFLLYEWHRYRRRKLILQKQHGKKPPYVWPVRVEAFAPKLYDQEVFYNIARKMRRRQAAEYMQLDVEASICATVESIGYPSFRYRLATRPPEYLILIERAGFRDHQAQHFNELTKALEREGVFVARYFFDDDPRVCCDESGGICLPLAELLGRHAGHRLLIFGDGEMLRAPVTGEPMPWTSLLTEWRDRSLLTPRPPAEWGSQETSLSSLFAVLPATLDGLLTLVGHLETLSAGSVDVRRQCGGERPPEFLLTGTTDDAEEIRAYLGEATFQWLCACAIYPELHWDLTLYLGSLPAMGGRLIREDNLLRLLRLPWFRSGSIPDGVRWLLIRELEQEKERAVRLAIVELLEKSPPPAETYASDAYQLNLAVQRWLSRRERRLRREAFEALSAAPRSRVVRDYTLMRFLEAAPGSALSLLLPRRLRRLFYSNGIPAFGLKTGVRLLCVVVIAAAGLVAREMRSTPDSPGVTVEARLDRAIAQNKLFGPPGESAFELYQELKNSGRGQDEMMRFNEALLPLLTAPVNQLLPDMNDPTKRRSDLVEDWENASKHLGWALEIRPDDAELAARKIYCEGRIAYLNKDTERALTQMKTAVVKDPLWAPPYNQIGLIYMELKQYAAARPYFLRAINLAPGWAMPYNNLGTSYFVEKNYRQAETYYRKAVQLAGGWARPHAWLADIAFRRGNYRTAVQEYQIVLDLNDTTMNLDVIRRQLDTATAKLEGAR